jgi:hypothetical protein
MGNITSIFATKPAGFRLTRAVSIKASPETIPRITIGRPFCGAGGNGRRERDGCRNTGVGRISIAGSSISGEISGPGVVTPSSPTGPRAIAASR